MHYRNITWMLVTCSGSMAKQPLWLTVPRFRLVGIHRHPLDPLTVEEVELAAESCRQHAAKLGLAPLRFNTITLQASLWHSTNRCSETCAGVLCSNLYSLMHLT